MRFFSFIPIAFAVCGPWAVIPATGQEPIWPAPAAGVSGEWSSEDCPPLPSMEIPVHEAIAGDDPNQTEPLPGFGSQFGLMPRVDQSNDFMQPFDDPIAQLPPVFVHERQTVRVSDRAAEIWVKLPKNSESSVSVNFVEYPPEGDFRIFKTKILTHTPRFFYVSAKSWAVKANRWIDLEWNEQLSTGGQRTFDYGNKRSGRLEIIVELQPGQRTIVEFDDPGVHDDRSSRQHPMESLHETLEKYIKPLNEQLTKTQQQLGTQKSQLDNMKGPLGEIQMLTKDIAAGVRKLEQAGDPEFQSPKVTAQFLFTDAALEMSGHRVIVNGEFKSIDWTSHPTSVVIAVPKSLAALPGRPFKADVAFSLQEGDGEPFATLDPITLEFSDFGNLVVAEIPFNQRLGVPLSDALVHWNKPAATYRVGANIHYELGLDKLDSVRISGQLGNEIELTTAP